jgi:ABC-type lipoprotein export system ATPase subunit
VVTHDPRVYGFADRIVHMEDGLITKVETTGLLKTADQPPSAAH